ncbi:LRFN4 [Branchiostoma lanceolatum]|uniref:LRFN4 protein n=1 Tax=Branchiostoma lanceolatum TaxID=7740 RepID=A0A8J9YM97_BRALA|nr:LRFN4 [Branchiostoma lanceolatum]
MASLQLLNLSHNAISNVSWESLGNMPDLLQLDLSFNRLTYVDVYPRRSLILFSVIYNKLETFSEEDLGILPRDLIYLTTTYKPYVEGNPLRCDCRMVWLQKLLRVLEKCQTGGEGRFSEACKPVQIHPLYLSLRRGLSSGFVCNSPENLYGVPISKVELVCDLGLSPTIANTASLHLPRTSSEANTRSHDHLLLGTTSTVPDTSTPDTSTTSTTRANKTVTLFKDDGHDSNMPELSVSSLTLLKVLCSVAIVVMVFLLVNVVFRHKCRIEKDALPPPQVNIPMQHIQNPLPTGRNDNSSHNIHVCENDNDETGHDTHNDIDNMGNQNHVYENDNDNMDNENHFYENDNDNKDNENHVY